MTFHIKTLTSPTPIQDGGRQKSQMFHIVIGHVVIPTMNKLMTFLIFFDVTTMR